MRPSSLALVATVLTLHPLSAQISKPTFSKPGKSAVIHFDQLAKEKSLGHALPLPTEIPEPQDIPGNLPIPQGARIVFSNIPAPEEAAPSAQAPIADPTFSSFQAVISDGYYPPDTDGAVGPSYVVAVLNEQFTIQDRSGNMLSHMLFSDFWSSLGYTDIFDPRVLYDAAADRWITAAVANRSSTTSSMLVAASATGDPRGAWHLYGYQTDVTGKSWADFTYLGYDATRVVMTSNLFPVTSGASGTKILSIPKAQLYAGSNPQAATFLPKNGFSLAAATSYDPNSSVFYLVQDWNGATGTIRVSTITGAAGSEVFTEGLTFVTINSTWGNTSPSSNIAPQLGTSAGIDLGDSRMGNCLLRFSSLWCAQNAFLPATAVTRVSAQWYQIDTATFSVTQFGRVDDPTGKIFYAYPSIAVNKNHDVLLGYSRFSLTQYAGSDFAFRYSNDPVNTLRSDMQFKTGENPYQKTDSLGRNRWGDYSTSIVDPVDNLTLWTIQEYSGSPSNTWSTYWSHVAPAGVVETYSITGTITAGGNALSGVTVALSGSSAATVTTDATGAYTFNGLSGGGNYTITPALTGYIFAPLNRTFTNLFINSVANFAATPTYTISGHVTISGAGLQGVTATLSGTQGNSVLTDVNGAYSFTGIAAAGTYTIRPTLSGYTFSPAFLTATNLAANQTFNFTATQITYTISGNVGSLSGVTMTLSGRTTTTDASGNYTFSAVAPGATYTLTPSRIGYIFTPPSQTFNNLSGNQTANFTATAVFTISGKMTQGANGLSAVTMVLSGAQNASTTTDGSGNYSFTNLAAGNYTVTPARAGFSFSPPGTTFNFLSANQTANFTATASSTTFTISGNIKLSGSALSGVAVALSGSTTASVISDASGNFTFPGLAAGGLYILTPSRTGNSFAPASLNFTGLSANQAAANFTATTVFSISGQVAVGSGGVSGVTMTLSGTQSATATTDASGNYAFAALPATGSYTITPSRTGSSFTPPNHVFTNLTANQIGNFSPVVTMSLSRAALNFGVSGALVTSPQTVAVTFTGAAGIPWSASSNKANIVVSPSSGTGNGTFQIAATAGASGQVTVTAASIANSPQTVQVNVANVTPGNPSGSFDTPLNNTTGIAGAIAVTGWALDNIEVTSVGIWREPVGGEATQPNGLVAIGNAVFVADARSDIQTANPTAPLNYRGGWGYLMLTNFLPPNGNGTYKLHAIAVNKAGSTLDLGTHIITVDNAHASRPFGAIDTPDQGGTASGNQFVNFGWGLTQNPFYIPTDGSTISVTVDGAVLGHPVYNQFRTDIATSFPGLANSNGAVAYFFIDTTTLTNGVHTIAWLVYDNQGRGDGIGSRFFNVLNSNSGTAAVPDGLLEEGDVPDHLDIEELGRVTLRAGATTGYQLVNGERRPLPPGSTIRNGTFYWQLAPGFLGDYTIVLGKHQIRIRVHPMQNRTESVSDRF